MGVEGCVCLLPITPCLRAAANRETCAMKEPPRVGVGFVEERKKKTHMWSSLLGTMRRSGPTMALPVASTRFSPFGVSGMSVRPVCLPLSDHSVSP